MPPAPLHERSPVPAKAVAESESEDDDDFGPSMPTAGAKQSDREGGDDEEPAGPTTSPPPEKPRRDEWMTMPPKQDDLAARMDPSKQRARGFNTGKGAKGPTTSGGDNSAWNETPEQKQKRLQEEMMGIAKPASPGPQNAGKPAGSAKDEAKDAKTREQIVSLCFGKSCEPCAKIHCRRDLVDRH